MSDISVSNSASPNPAASDRYVVGGPVAPDSPSYVVRNADGELLDRIIRGDFCYVLTARQIGKSSLMVKTIQKLRSSGFGFRCAAVDLTQIGTELTAAEWYRGLAERIKRDLGLKTDLSAWWRERSEISHLQRLSEFFEDVVLQEVPSPERVVTFVDEIDTTIKLPFADDFFAAVRALYTARALHPDYKRLSFVLLGVATPAQLIKDPRRTPFNIGTRIDLGDFTEEEARRLDPDRPQVLERVLYWTHGHPYLTQKLLQATGEESSVDDVVNRLFFSAGSLSNDDNLKLVASRLTGRALLQLLIRIRKGKRVKDDPASTLKAALKLSGVVRTEPGGSLVIRNRIYEHVFTAKWAKAAMPTDWRLVGSVSALVVGFVVWYTLLLPRPYINQIEHAVFDYPSVAYKKLHSMPFYSTRADHLLADYWDNRADMYADGERAYFLLGRLAESDTGGEAFLCRLRALQLNDTLLRRQLLGRMIMAGYGSVVQTARIPGEYSWLEVDAVSWSGHQAIVQDLSRGLVLVDLRHCGAEPLAHGTETGQRFAFSPDGKSYAVWRPWSSQEIEIRDGGGSRGYTIPGLPNTGGGTLWAFEFADEYHLLIALDERAFLLDIGSGLTANVANNYDLASNVASYSKGRQYQLFGEGNFVRVRRLTGMDGFIVKTTGRIANFAISPQGRLLAVQSRKSVETFDTTNPSSPLAKVPSDFEPQEIEVSEDGSEMLAKDGLSVWHLKSTDSGQEICSIGTTPRYETISRRLITGMFIVGLGTSVTVWNRQTCRIEREMDAFGGKVSIVPETDTVIVWKEPAGLKSEGTYLGPEQVSLETGRIVSDAYRLNLGPNLDFILRDQTDMIQVIDRNDDKVAEVPRLFPRTHFALASDHPGFVRMVTQETPNALRILDIPINPANAPPIKGDSTQLLQEWEHRLALTFNDNQEIVPSPVCGIKLPED